MDIIKAFTAMTFDLTLADASERQVGGVDEWEDYVRAALRHARAVNASPQCLDVRFGGSHTHRTWRTSSFAILRVLAAQSDEGRVRRCEAEMLAGEEEHLACQADAGAAAAEDEGAAEALRAEAEEHRAAAEKARSLAAGLIQWEIAAGDAYAFGTRVLANEQRFALPVAGALAAAGGEGEVPDDKRYAAEHRDGRRAA